MAVARTRGGGKGGCSEGGYDEGSEARAVAASVAVAARVSAAGRAAAAQMATRWRWRQQ